MENTNNAVYTVTTTGAGERKPLGLWRKAVSVLLAMVLAFGVWAVVPFAVSAKPVVPFAVSAKAGYIAKEYIAWITTNAKEIKENQSLKGFYRIDEESCVFYKFAPKKTGVYELLSGDCITDSTGKIINRSYSSNGYSTEFRVRLTAGKDYYIGTDEVHWDWEKDDYNEKAYGNVKIKRLPEIKAIELASPKKPYEINGSRSVGGALWSYSSAPFASIKLRVSFDNGKNKTIAITEFDDTGYQLQFKDKDNKWKDFKNIGFMYAVYPTSSLKLGKNNVAFRVKENPAVQTKFNVDLITLEEHIKRNKIKVKKLTVGKTIPTINSGHDDFYAFTPNATAIYRFNCYVGNGSLFRLYNQNGDTLKSLSAKTGKFKLTKGKTYYLNLAFDSHSDGMELLTRENVKLTKLDIGVSKEKATLGVGKTTTLKATVASNVKNKKVTWTSSNKKIATVDKTGKVKGVKAGKVKITAKLANGKKEVCTVTVKKVTAVPNTKAVPKNQGIKKNKTIILTAPKDTTLYYTTNGKNPTTSTKTKINPGKTKAIKISKKTEVRVIAVKKGFIASSVVTRTYTLK